ARAFLAGLNPEGVAPVLGSLHAGGTLRLGSEAIVIDQMYAEGDRMAFKGRLEYLRPNSERAARLGAEIEAKDIDLDRVQSLAKDFFGDSATDWPSQGSLKLNAQRARAAGVEIRGADIAISLDARRFAVQSFTIADFGGSAVTLKGQIDGLDSSLQGGLRLDLNVRALQG